jgi:hypothetical protein
MIMLILTVVLAGTRTCTYDADVPPNQARPPWSFHEINNCSATVERGVLHVVDRGTAQGELQFISYPRAEHHIVFKQEGVYACFPSLYQFEDGMLVSRFGTRVRRSHIDNAGGSRTRVSRDGGIHWDDADATVPGYNPAQLREDGHLAIANAIGWRYVDEGQRETLKAEGRTVRSVRPGTVAYLSGARSMIRSIHGEVVRPWSEIPIPRGGGMMTFHQAAYLPVGDGVRLVAIYDTGPDKQRSAYVLRTEDDGDTWTCLPMALGDDRMSYNETALGLNAEGHVIALMRTAESADRSKAGFLQQVTSTDGGKTWSEPVDTGIWGYPAHLLRLPSGQLLATYGYRRAPMGIRACLSPDGGTSWNIDDEIILRADGAGSGSDLGYPITQRLADGTLATVYYFNGADNITHICLTRWTPPDE